MPVNSDFLAGVLVAWTIAQVALGIFFVLAERVGRRPSEYLLFGVLCFLLAIITGSIAQLYSVGSFEELGPIRLANAAAILAGPVNLHFVYWYAGARRPRGLLWAMYIPALLLEVANLTLWWGASAWVPIEVGVLQGVGRATLASAPCAYFASLLWVGQLLLAGWLLLARVREGDREALSAFVGVAVLLAAVTNDVGLVSGVLRNSLYLVPHAFLAYGFGVATTLLFRYQATSGALEQSVVQLENSSRELRRSHEDLKIVQAELIKKQQLAAVGELAAVIAHEVRNPLAIIVNAVAALRRQRVTEEDRLTLLGIVEEETARLNRLVTDLLRYSRPMTLKRAPISLADMARRVPAMDKYDCSIEFKIAADPELETIWVDPTLFRVVFDNLVDNACQAMPNGGNVLVNVTRHDKPEKAYARIEISDAGRGMEADTLHRARDPFFTTRPSGTGLGLPIVQRIIEAHGGEIKLESEPSRGTTVTLLIPLGEPIGPDGSLRLGGL